MDTKASMTKSVTFVDVSNTIFHGGKISDVLSQDVPLLEMHEAIRIYLHSANEALFEYQTSKESVEDFRQLSLAALNMAGVFLSGTKYTYLEKLDDYDIKDETTFFIPWSNIISMHGIDSDKTLFNAV